MKVKLLHTVLLALVVPVLLVAQGKPDLVIFDDDDPTGTGYYDASSGFRNAPSSQLLGGPGSDKLTIISSNKYSGNDAGVIQWTSAPNGSWGMFIASVLWQGRDASAYDSIVFFVNGPAPITFTALPKVNLESTTNAKPTGVDMETYLPAGIDGDPATWQRVSIPLTAFQPYGSFSLSIFKDINFSQKLTDNIQHTMWIDNIRIVAKVALVDSTSPQTPARVVSRSGDQSIVLHWNRNLQSNLSGFNIYRASSRSGPYTKLNTSLSVSPGFVDFDVTNGQTRWYYVRSATPQGESASSDTVAVAAKAFANDDEFLDYLEATAFDYFWYEANPLNGLIRDRSQPASPSSIAAVGFGLTAIGIGIDKGYITRAEGRDRTLTTLKTFWEKPQGTAALGMIGYKGWFYHFLDVSTGLRTWDSELSSIDTGLLLAGILYARQYFDATDSLETQIQALADSIFNRIDWNWMTNGQPSLTMGWYPDERGFISARWIGYNEAMILNIMGIGAGLSPQVWDSWTSGYVWQPAYGSFHVTYPALFVHQYSHCWIDFRNIQDGFMRGKGITYFENSRRATLANRLYCIFNPKGFAGYDSLSWGITACDGPRGYAARGIQYPPPNPAYLDDGTIAPTAAGGSIVFTPNESIATLRHFFETYRAQLWGPYGFKDAFNKTENWFATDVIGIDQGAIILMIENYRTGKVWNVFMRNPYIQTGLSRIGFSPVPSVPEDEGQVAMEFRLHQNYPNPFNGQTSIVFDLPTREWVSLRVVDLLGREVATLVDDLMAPGTHSVQWSPGMISSGIYFSRLRAGSRAETKKMILLR